MIIPIILVVGILIGLFLLILEKEKGEPPLLSFAWFLIGFSVIIVYTLNIIVSYMPIKAELQVIDQKIEVTRQNNLERISTVLPILEKYPEIEEEIISNIRPEAFAVLGDVYPKLKSNESYNAQTKIILSNIQQIEKLQISKLDLEKEIIVARYNLFFLN